MRSASGVGHAKRRGSSLNVQPRGQATLLARMNRMMQIALAIIHSISSRGERNGGLAMLSEHQK